MNVKKNYVLVSSNQPCQDWLNEVCADTANIIQVDTNDIERITQLVDAASAHAVLIHLQSQDTRTGSTVTDLSPKDLRVELSLIESLVANRPSLPVLAIAKAADENLLLAIMRAGVRDFIKMGMRSSELLAVLGRQFNRDGVSASPKDEVAGKITAIISARPNNDAPFLAAHLAIAMQQQEPTLLIDLGIPHSECTLYMGLSTKYSFLDALRNLRRLDATLIQTGFSKHKSGLAVLAMPEEGGQDVQFTSADIYMMLRTMRRYFSQIVINVGAVTRLDFLSVVLANVDNTIMLAEQSLPSCKKNFELLKQLRENKVQLQNAGLVVDRYLPSLLPDCDSISQSFDLPLLATMPPSGMARLTATNSGESMFVTAPNDPYLTSLRELTAVLSGRQPARKSSGLERLTQMIARYR